MKIFGVDPGSQRTGYGCIELRDSRHHMIDCGALTTPPRATLPEKLLAVHSGLAELLAQHHPDAVAIEDLFYARNARSALILGHVRGVLILAASEANVPIWEYSPTEVKRAVVGYGRAEKRQVQQMVTLLLGMSSAPTLLDVSDALAVAVCHSHSIGPTREASQSGIAIRGWRRYRPPERVE